jgi:Chalcone isomerase-like
MRTPPHRTAPRRRACLIGALSLAAPPWLAPALVWPGLGVTLSAAAQGAAAAPGEVAAALAGPRLQGSGNLRFFGLKVYDARLWVGERFDVQRFESHAFALELVYARKLQGAAIAQRSIVEMRRAGPLSDSQAQAWEAAMLRGFPNVDAGDRLSGVHLPGEATRFFHNGRATAEVADPSFGRAFFGIWLAETTSEPDLRRQLIGLA